MGRIRKWAGLIVPPPGKHQTLRFFLFLMLIGCIIWVYRIHFDRRLEEVQAAREIVDRVGILSTRDKKTLKALVREYKRTYGIRLHLEIRDQDGALPAISPQTLLAVLGPEPGQCTVVLPHLVRKALPAEAEPLYAERLSSCTRMMPPGACLERFLLALRDELQQ